MKINISFKDFKKKHKNKKNQIIFHKIDCKNNKIIENIINNFLIRKNTFIFESVEKQLLVVILIKFGNLIIKKFILFKIIKKKKLNQTLIFF